MARQLAFCSLLALLASVALSAPSASAQPSAGSSSRPPPCPEAIAGWAAECGASTGLVVEPLFCDGDIIVLIAGVAGQPALHVDVRPDPEGMFREASGYGLSPVIGTGHWATAPPEVRDAFEAIVGCVEAQAPPRHDGERSTRGDRLSSPAGPPLSFLGAVLLMLFVFGRRGARTPRAGRQWLALLGLMLATLMARRMLVPDAFFHQNGQGPLWVDFALCRQSSYGAGFRELFGWAATLAGSRPERGVFWVNAVLLAFGPALAWLLARGVGAGRWLAYVVAGLVALDPALARLAGSESYYGAGTALVLLALTTLVWGARSRTRRDMIFGLAVVAAGLFVAQAARMHPVIWVASSLSPFVILLVPGRPRERIAQTALAGFGIAIVVAFVAVPDMLQTLAGPLGEQWLGQASGTVQWQPRHALVLLPMVALPILSRDRRRGALAGFVLTLSVGALVTTDRLHPWIGIIQQAHHHLYLAPILAGAVAALAGLPRREGTRRLLAGLVAAGGLVVFGLFGPGWMTLPTDVLEYQHVVAWRDTLPASASVVYVSRADRWVSHLPISECVEAHPRPVAVRPGEPLPPMPSLGDDVYLYLGALCEAPEVEALCASLRHQRSLEPVVEHELPARPSLPWLTFPEPVVHTGLYRVQRSD